jgi:uncharacterized spore protein YtfJ
VGRNSRGRGETEKKEDAMAVMDKVIEGVRDSATVRKVYGDPIEKEGMTIIPAAAVMGGGGGGEGEGPEQQGAGQGAGYGVRARPIGVYVVRNGDVEWKPSVDVTRLAVAGMALAAVIALTVRAILGRR